jgi:peptide/nickel transport system substrate-binding protein
MKKTLVIAIVVLLFLAATIAVTAGGTGEPQTAAPTARGGLSAGGTLTFGVYRPIPNLAYYHAYDASNNITAVAIWDTLLRFNEKAEIEPGLAASWEVKDGNTIILHLREGVKFHDGTTLDAEDVIASMELAVDPESKSPMAWMLDPIDSIDALDSMTVQIKTGAVVDILNALATPIGAVSSKEAVEKYGIGLGENPIGAGPFKLESWERGSRVVLTKFDDYWEEGKPYLDKIIFNIVIEEFTRLSSLRSGDLDIVYNMSFANVEKLEGNKDFNTNIFGTYIVYYLALNMKKAPFNDVRVRQALNYAIDRSSITKAVIRGYAEPAITDIAPAMAGSLKGVRDPYPYDPAKAKALLKEAGYGNGFSMKLLVGANSPDAETGVVLQEYYKAIGVKVELVSEEASLLWNHLQAGNYEDAAMSFWYPDFPDAAGTLVPFCYSTNTPPDGCCNFSYYANAEVDKLLDEAAAETDVARRAQLFQEVNKIVYEEAPRVWIYHIKEAMPATNKLKGLKPGPMFFFQHFLQDVWLEK